MAILTKEEFINRWNNDNPPLTNNDIADCASAWGLAFYPRTMPVRTVVCLVLDHLGIDYLDYE